MSVVVDWGAEQRQMPGQGTDGQGAGGAMPDTLYADAGYDAEWVHVQCREEWGPESVIKPAVHRADGKRNGIWRSGMSKNYLVKMQYGSRSRKSVFQLFKSHTSFSGHPRIEGTGQIIMQAAIFARF
jgi:hypothetical protein